MRTKFKFQLYLKHLFGSQRYTHVYKFRFIEGNIEYEHVADLPQQYLHPEERKRMRKVKIGSYVIFKKEKAVKYA